MAYIYRVEAKATGSAVVDVSDRFKAFTGAVEKALGRDCTVGAEVIERDFETGADEWKGRLTLLVNIAPDVDPEANSVHDVTGIA